MASLYKRPDSRFWQISYKICDVRTRESTYFEHDGREKPLATSKVLDLLDRRKAQERAYRRGESVDIAPARVKIQDWCVEWLDLADIEESSRTRYQTGIRSFLKFCDGRHTYLSTISRGVCARYFDSLAGWAPNSLKSHKALLKQIWDAARARDYVRYEVSPWESVVIKRSQSRSDKHVLTNEEIQTIMESDVPAWLKLATQICLYTGCRGDNLKDLVWSQIHFEPFAVIIFHRSKTGGYSVPMHPELAKHLRVACVGDIMTGEEIGDLFVFPELRGKTDAYLSNTFSRAMKRLKIPATLHCLRHTCNTRLLQSGVSKEHAMAILNHSSATVNDIYTHVSAAALVPEVMKLSYGT